MLTHKNLWEALDLLARSHGLTPSGLARKAGLSATALNPGRRQRGAREHWPSCESVAALLKATNCSFSTFAALLSAKGEPRATVPLFLLTRAPALFPEGGTGESMPLPAAFDERAFALEVDTSVGEPFYPRGTILLLAPEEKIRRGDRVVARTKSGEILMKRLSREGSQHVELSALVGEGEPPLTLARRELAWIHKIAWASQ